MSISSGKVSRRMSTLHKMVDAAAAGAEGVTWNHVLQYLIAHCTVEDEESVSDDKFESGDEMNSHATRNRSNTSNNRKNEMKIAGIAESPIPSYYEPTEELLKEMWLDKSKGDSLLRSCLSSAPPKVIAALSQLCPEALVTPDTQDRLPLHYACRYPASERLDAVMMVLIANGPEALVHRDTDGRTPLHYLVWYHARDRNPPTVAFFCQNLSAVKSEFYKLQQPSIQRLPNTVSVNKYKRRQLLKGSKQQQQFPLPDIPKPSVSSKIPFSAAIVPDAAHGCLPLHYAVMKGASKQVIQTLIQVYPQSKHFVDRYGRTPLHWYLGAGCLDIRDSESSLPQDVSGEEVPMDPKLKQMVKPSYERQICPEVVQLLVSSRVARTADFQQRYPLHWAACFLAHNYILSANPGWAMSLKIVKLLLDNFVGQLTCCDEEEMTPIMLMFETVSKLQKREWKLKAREQRRLMYSLVHGASQASLFGPPLELLDMLLKHPDPSANANVAAMEDATGRLPVHAALEVASSPECVALLIQCHPTALIHTAEETLFVPLHSAFCHEHTAPLQTVEIISLLLQSMQAGRYGTVVDGRLAMKMEDANGFYPIHFATQNGACFDVIKLFVDRYANTALQTTPCGDLPVHCVMTEELMLQATAVNNEKMHNDCTECDDDLDVSRRKIRILLEPLLTDPNKLAVADSQHGMLPLHCAVLFEAAEYPLLLRMLELHPESAYQFTRNQSTGGAVNIGSFSPLDLHEICKSRKKNSSGNKMWVDEWHRKRELLFSFSPTLESHRHRQELLDRCVRVVIDELNETTGTDSTEGSIHRYHLEKGQTASADAPIGLEISHSVSDMEKAVLQTFGFQNVRPPRRSSNQSTPKSPAVASGAVALLQPELPSPKTKASNTSSRSGTRKKKIESQEKKEKDGPALKTSSSVYDDETTAFDYETFTEWFDGAGGDESESVFSGVDTDEPYSSELDEESEDETDTCDDDEDLTDQYSHRDISSAPDGSRSFDYTSSASRLQTTFEEDDASSATDDDTRTSDDDTRSYTDDTGSHTEGESTMISRQQTHESDANAFDLIKESLEAEEKKDDYSFGGDIRALLSTPRTANNNRRVQVLKKPQATKITFRRPDYISEVAMRLWTFFVLYCDPNNPNDNYVKQVSDIIDEIKFSTVEKLVMISLPPYAQHYVEADDIGGLTFRDVASPKCRELIQKTCYFLGRYDLNLQQHQEQESKTSILLQRAPDGSSVSVRALEWIFTTEEVTPARDTGIAVENIWATGEVPAEVGVTFRSQKRPVWIKFTKDENLYKNEVSKRKALGLAVEDDGIDDSTTLDNARGIVPLFNHFNAKNAERKNDRTYKCDINDERFNVINLFGGDSEQFKLHLDEYPFALVYPASSLGGTMYDFFSICGLQNSSTQDCLFEEKRKAISDVTSSLRILHDRDICHCGVAMRNITKFSNKFSPGGRWSFIDLSTSSSVNEETSYLGGITAQGFPLFQTGSLPPEMFIKLSAPDFKKYTRYWNRVQEVYKIVIDKSILRPHVDLETGEKFVIKAHFIPFTNGVSPENQGEFEIPTLPYDLVPIRKSTDMWALGQLIFLLYSGRPLLPTDERSGRLLDYAGILRVNRNRIIYEYIEDPLTQDVLLRLLGSPLSREEVSAEQIMTHPFLAKKHGSSAALVKQIVEKRKIDRASHNRDQQRKMQEASDREWLEKRTHKIACWDFDILERIYLSPNEIVKSMAKRMDSISLPCGFLMLPYQLSSPSPVTEIEKLNLAKRIGEEFLQLSKACYFTSIMKQATSTDEHDVPQKWSSSEMLRVLDLSSDDFGDMQNEMADLAAKHVEIFRNDPISVALKIVQKRILGVIDCFDDMPLYLYIVDEFSCMPILQKTSPIEVSENWRENVLRNGILSMHLSMLYARGVAKNISGLSKLMLQDVNLTVPATWSEASIGLFNRLDEVSFMNEISLLQDALSGLFSSKHNIGDDILVIHNFLSEVDPDRELAGAQRVHSGGASLWTTSEGVKQLEYMADSLSFKDALRSQRRMEAIIKDSKRRADRES